jgi:hypothetical protein
MHIHVRETMPMIILVIAASMTAAPAPADSYDDVRRFAATQHIWDIWDLHDAKAMPGWRRVVCGRTDRFVRSGPHRFVYAEANDGTPPAILEENDMPADRAMFFKLWGDGGCR